MGDGDVDGLFRTAFDEATVEVPDDPDDLGVGGVRPVETDPVAEAATGRVVTTAPPTPIAVDLGGRVVRMVAVPLDGLGEGDYELILEVVDQASGWTLSTRETFVLER